jgi:hypothetical protein
MSPLAAIALVSAAMLFGGMAFFAACVAPVAFARLPPEWAGRFIRGIFPLYYLWVLGTAAAAAFALLPIRVPDALALAAVAAVTAWLRQSLMPRINALSDAAQAGDAAARAAFDRLHGVSVRVNLVQMAVALVVLARFA